MKVYMIKASAPGPFKEYKKYMGSPPQNIFSLAACTPKGVKIDICDETSGMKPKKKSDADIIVIMFHTPDAVHAYKMADAYRAKGRTVVLGGLHPTFEPDEAQAHADALLLGEAEGIWTRLLKDYKAGKLKKRYERTGPVDMATLKPFPTNLIKPSQYDGVWTVLVSRGCVHRCEYCVVPPFFKGKYRVRPIEHIVAEIKAAPSKWFELHADNLTADREYAIELFKALKPLKINWVGESTIKMADDEELLSLAAESGCKYLLVGIETPSKAALEASGKGFVSPDETRDRIRKFHKHGIIITSSMMFGFDGHTKDIFQESLDFCNEIEIDEVESVILAPFAGTPFYKRMKEEGRLLTTDWAKYDCSSTAFQPQGMTPSELDAGAVWFWKQISKRKPTAAEVNGKKKAQTPATPSNGGTMTRTIGTPGGNIKWKTLLALLLIGTAVWTGYYWLWGLLFAYWVIKDLREGRAYIVEDIPRSESPFLFWIVITMWFCFTLFAFSTAPLIQDWLEQYDDPKVSSIIIEPLPLIRKAATIGKGDTPSVPAVSGEVTAPTPRKQVVRPVPTKSTPENQTMAFKTVRESQFGMRIVIPEAWKASDSKISGGRQLDIESPSGYATLTSAAMNMGTTMSATKFVRLMEKELASDLPFVKVGNGTPITLKGDAGLQFKEYSGNLGNQPITALVGYGVKRTKGFLLVGVFAPSDISSEKNVRKSMESFTLDS